MIEPRICTLLPRLLNHLRRVEHHVVLVLVELDERLSLLFGGEFIGEATCFHFELEEEAHIRLEETVVKLTVVPSSVEGIDNVALAQRLFQLDGCGSRGERALGIRMGACPINTRGGGSELFRTFLAL